MPLRVCVDFGFPFFATCNSHFGRNASYRPMSSGKRWDHTVRASQRIRGAAAEIIGFSLKRSCELLGRVACGAVCQLCSATRARPFVGSEIGAKPMSSSAFSTPYRRNPTWNTPWSMRSSSRFTATGRAQKGDSGPGNWPLQRRHDQQASGPDRRTGQPCLLPPTPVIRGSA